MHLTSKLHRTGRLSAPSERIFRTCQRMFFHSCMPCQRHGYAQNLQTAFLLPTGLQIPLLSRSTSETSARLLQKLHLLSSHQDVMHPHGSSF